MKKLVAMFCIFASLVFADEEKYTPYISYMIQQNGISLPVIGIEFENGSQKVDIWGGYSLLATHPSYHYTNLSLNYGYSLWKEEMKDIYFKGGVRLTNIYCRKDPLYNSSRFWVFPQIGVGTRVTSNLNLEIYYQPFYFTDAHLYQAHSTYLRLMFHL